VNGSQAKDTIALRESTYYVVGIVVAMHGTLSDKMKTLGWLPVCIYALLTLEHGCFRFFKGHRSLVRIGPKDADRVYRRE